MDTTPSNTKEIKISVTQFFMLAVTFVISTSDVFLPAFVAQEAKQDAWISVIIATAGSLIIANMFLTLGNMYPDKTLAEYACDILGKPLGMLVGLSYVYFFLAISWLVTSELEEIFVISFNPDSPVIVYGIITILVAAYAVYCGLEVIARINEILLPLGILILLIIALINIPNMDMYKLLPVLYNGIYPPIKGAFLIQTWLTETVVFLQILPYIKERQKIRKYLNLSILTLGGSLMVGILTITVFGVGMTAKLLFPALEYVRFARLGSFLQNLDISIMVVWISGIFVKIAFSYFAGALSLSQALGFKSYKNIIFPVGVLIIAMSCATATKLTNMLFFLKYILPEYFVVMTTLIPLLLLIVAMLRKRK